MCSVFSAAVAKAQGCPSCIKGFHCSYINTDTTLHLVLLLFEINENVKYCKVANSELVAANC